MTGSFRGARQLDVPQRTAIETCLADLVAAGDLDPYELASFRCQSAAGWVNFEGGEEFPRLRWFSSFRI